MPTTYAHYRFGCDVYRRLTPEIRKLIDTYRDLYDWGVHGPDVLFYYRPLRPHNQVAKTGKRCHKMTGRTFFRRAEIVIEREMERGGTAIYTGKNAPVFSDAPEAPYLVYMLGVYCHYILDRECHPYVYEKQLDGVSHSAIEASFDRHLMVMDDLDPLKHKTTDHLRPSRDSAAIMKAFYNELTTEQIYEAQLGMIGVLDILASHGLRRRVFATAAGPLKQKDLFITRHANQACTDSDGRLTDLYVRAIARAEALFPEFLSAMMNRTPLPGEFDHTFGKN